MIDLLLLIAGAALAMCGLYLVVLAVAALFYRSSQRSKREPRSRIVVLVPAHNESGSITTCVGLLERQIYPARLRKTVVVADNCTDDTAARARAAGARVLVRDEPEARGKGHALAWAIDRLLGEQPRPDAIVVVDADSIVDPDMVAALVDRFESGDEVVQGEYLMLDDGSMRSALRSAAFRLMNRVRPAGHAALGLPCCVTGNGMLLGSDALQRVPWQAFSSTEDAEYGVQLKRARIYPVFEANARVAAPAPPSKRAADEQQLRWEGGKMHLARMLVPSLVARAFVERRPLLLEMALDLAIPPLGLLGAVVGAGTIACAALLGTGVAGAAPLVVFLVALVSIPVHVLVGLRAGDAPASEYRALVRTPVFVLAKLVRLPRLLRFRADSWVRTERPGERSSSDTSG